MKKSAEVADLPEDVVLEHEKNNQKEGARQAAGLLGKIKWDDVKHILLLILEKVVRKSRMLFLKLESKFDSWSKHLRSKKVSRGRKSTELFESEKEGDIMNRLANYEFKNYDEPTFVRPTRKEVAQDVEEEVVIEEDRSQINRPVASRNVSETKKPVEIRDRLEELLIERIAINPKDTEAYERLGEYYMEIESWTDAKECFKQVIKLDSKNRNAKYKIRRLENILAARK
jgi:tetratricopeptide (TPR) repeat protein